MHLPKMILPTIAAVMLLTALAPTASLAIDLQGHRGARALAPENTLPGFAAALSIGVTTLEMDLALSRDGIVMVAHDPLINPDLARATDGTWLEEDGPPLYALSRAEIQAYDVGRLKPGTDYAARFKDQEPVDGTPIPTLAEVIALTNKASNGEVRFNLETKLSPLEPEITAPPADFAKAVIEAVRQGGIEARTTIQSFDWRTLQEVNRLAPDIETVCLSAEEEWLDNIERGKPGPSPWTAGFDIDDVDGDTARLVQAAGCAVWSPYDGDLTAEALAAAKEIGLPVVVWTTNERAEMDRLIELGVDGIISDAPDELRKAAIAKGLMVAAPTPVEP